jgi:hypothetical protein
MTASLILVFKFSNFQVGKSSFKSILKVFRDWIAKGLKARDLTKFLREIFIFL